MFNVNVNKGEKIIGIFGRSAALIDHLGFFTNHGRVFGPHGGHGGGHFSVRACNIHGIFGINQDRCWTDWLLLQPAIVIANSDEVNLIVVAKLVSYY